MATSIMIIATMFVIGRTEDATEPPDAEDVFGISVQQLTELVELQPYVSSCQYAIIKTQNMYDRAKQQCLTTLDSKGNTVIIRNEQENKAIHSLFVATFAHGTDKDFLRSSPLNYMWLGLTRPNDFSNKWRWDSHPDIPINYTNWKEGHPKGGTSARMNRNGYWESITNIVQHPIVCERSAKYVVFKKRLRYDDAYDVCTNMSMSLARVLNATENEELVRAASRSLGSPYIKNINRNFEHINQVWLGGYEDESDHQLYWQDGQHVTYENFEPTYGKEFSGTGNVRISIDKIRKDWKLEKGDQERSFACQCPTPGKDMFETLSNFDDESEVASLEAIKGERECKKRFYGFGRLETYFTAKMACRVHGLQLAKLSNEKENAYVVKMMNNLHQGGFAKTLYDGVNWFWIGGTDDSVEGYFKWEDGSPFEYSNWAKGQPDNAHPLRGGQSKVSVYRGTGEWDDSHSNVFRSYVCYDPRVTFTEELNNGCAQMDDPPGRRLQQHPTITSTEANPKKDTDELLADEIKNTGNQLLETRVCIKKEYQGQYYVSPDTKSYENAKMDCVAKGMVLARVYDYEVNRRLQALALMKMEVTGYVLGTMGELSYFWIGLEFNDQNKISWMNDERAIFDNFKNFKERHSYSKEGNIDVVAANKVDGTWEWKSREENFMYICEEENKWVCTMSRQKSVN